MSATSRSVKNRVEDRVFPSGCGYTFSFPVKMSSYLKIKKINKKLKILEYPSHNFQCSLYLLVLKFI